MMNSKQINKESKKFNHFKFLANQVMEGYISGIHKSPFHGFSAEFAEHKLYNKGESTKHIDWKLFAKIDKLYTKKYEEETNLRCQIIIDSSSSMYFKPNKNRLRKIDFAVIASLSLMQIFQKQRDAIGLSIYNDEITYHQKAKGNNAHFSNLENKLIELIDENPQNKKTKTFSFLHQLAETLSRRSLIFIFSDLLQTEVENQKLLEAIQHLKFNKHQVVIFHTFNEDEEVNLDFENKPIRFHDLETNQSLDVFPEQIKDEYVQKIKAFKNQLKNSSQQYQINYQYCNVNRGTTSLIKSFLEEVQ
ncbi:DUF58 domain-containing protein [Psychroflexus maritimus]|nr:DUF58 domain-containing protein [Psychroflexus maritimus]